MSPQKRNFFVLGTGQLIRMAAVGRKWHGAWTPLDIAPTEVLTAWASWSAPHSPPTTPVTGDVISKEAARRICASIPSIASGGTHHNEGSDLLGMATLPIQAFSDVGYRALRTRVHFEVIALQTICSATAPKKVRQAGLVAMAIGVTASNPQSRRL